MPSSRSARTRLMLADSYSAQTSFVSGRRSAAYESRIFPVSATRSSASRSEILPACSVMVRSSADCGTSAAGFRPAATGDRLFAETTALPTGAHGCAPAGSRKSGERTNAEIAAPAA